MGVSRERRAGWVRREMIYVDKNLMRNRSMQTTKIWTFFSTVRVCNRQGQEQ